MKIYKIDVLNLVGDGSPNRTIQAEGFELVDGNRIQFYKFEEGERTRGKRYIASYPAEKINIKGIEDIED